MRAVGVRERCSCGATFEFDTAGTFAASDTKAAVTHWRETHRHEWPPQPRQRIPMAPRSAR